MNKQRKSVTIISASLEHRDGFFQRSEFFFSRDHCQGVASGDRGTPLSARWCPCTLSIGGVAAPRPGLEDGLKDSIEKLMFVYCSRDLLIPNPEPEYEVPELYERFAMLRNNTASIPVPEDFNTRGYVGRSELTDVQRQLMALWEPEQVKTDEELRQIYDQHNALFTERCRLELLDLESRLRDL